MVHLPLTSSLQLHEGLIEPDHLCKLLPESPPIEIIRDNKCIMLFKLLNFRIICNAVIDNSHPRNIYTELDGKSMMVHSVDLRENNCYNYSKVFLPKNPIRDGDIR